MPTGASGLNHDSVYDMGDDVLFREFALRCALDFIRYDSKSAKNPKEFKPSSYHKKELAKAEQKLNHFEDITDDEANILANEYYICEVKKYNQNSGEKQKLEDGYNDMLAQVEKWEVPSPNHKSFKDFMKERLEGSLKSDCNYASDIPKYISGTEYKKKLIAEAKGDIKYHQKKYAKEVKQAIDKTRWVQELVKGLP